MTATPPDVAALIARLRFTPTKRTWDSVGRPYDYPEHLPIEAADMIRSLADRLAAVEGERDELRASIGDYDHVLAALGMQDTTDSAIERVTELLAAEAALQRARDEDQPPEWLWWAKVDGRDVVTFGRWPIHGAQWRYKLADVQPVEHDYDAISARSASPGQADPKVTQATITEPEGR